MRNQFFQDFADKDWSSFFGNFEDPIKELVKEFYFNAWFTGAELKCWVWENDFVITLDYLAKILHINLPENVDTSPYDDRLALVAEILDTLGVDHEVSSTGTSIGTTKFGPEMKMLTLIMFYNLYPLSNTGFINLKRAQFLCDLIKGAQIDIMLTYFRPWEKQRGDWLEECVYPSAAFPWRSWLLRVFILQKKE